MVIVSPKNRNRTKTPEISVRTRLLCILATVALALLTVIAGHRGQRFTTVLDLATDLKHHIISGSSESNPPAALLVGACEFRTLGAELGELLPPGTSFNLSTNSGNPVTAMAFAAQGLAYHPKVVVLGLDTDGNWLDKFWSVSAVLMSDTLAPYLPTDLAELLEREGSWRYRFYFATYFPLRDFEQFILPAKDQLWSMLRSSYGSIGMRLDPVPRDRYLEEEHARSRASLWRDLPAILRGFKRLVGDHGAKLVAYLTPIFLPDEERSLRYNRIRAMLKAEGIPFIDHAALLGGNRGYFRDPVRFSPEGARYAAARLAWDLAGLNLRGHPCAADAEKFCAGAAPEGKAGCLGNHTAELSPACRALGAPVAANDPCAEDLARFCPGATPGEGRECLSKHFGQLAVNCQPFDHRFDDRFGICELDPTMPCCELPRERRLDCMRAG